MTPNKRKIRRARIIEQLILCEVMKTRLKTAAPVLNCSFIEKTLNDNLAKEADTLAKRLVLYPTHRLHKRKSIMDAVLKWFNK